MWLRVVLSAVLLVGAFSSRGATPDQGDYRYTAQPSANQCSTGGRVTPCISQSTPLAAGAQRSSTDAPPQTVTKAARCGDGVCEASRGESAGSCPADCT